jgi:hypothetical protein
MRRHLPSPGSAANAENHNAIGVSYATLNLNRFSFLRTVTLRLGPALAAETPVYLRSSTRRPCVEHVSETVLRPSSF